MRLGFVFSRSAIAFAFPIVAVSVAASCKSTDAPPPTTACAAYFDAVNTNACGVGPTLPSDELARLRARFESICGGYGSLPGAKIADADIKACADAIRAAGCAGAGTTPAACVTLGDEPTGAGCNEPFQCQSGVCVVSAAPPGDAATVPNRCGSCAPVARLGEACSQNCVNDAICDRTMPTPVCVAVTRANQGEPCDGKAAQCNPGLRCDSTQKCAPLFAIGSTCIASTQCAPPAVCRNHACSAPGADGEACADDTECASGLACDFAKRTCGAVAWIAAGQPCGGLARCTVGSCSMQTQSCPRVVADGQPCTADDPSMTCDTYADCIGGACVREDSQACR